MKRYANNGMIVIFAHVVWVDHGEDDEGRYACIHLLNGEMIELEDSECDEFLREFNAWCDAE